MQPHGSCSRAIALLDSVAMLEPQPLSGQGLGRPGVLAGASSADVIPRWRLALATLRWPQWWYFVPLPLAGWRPDGHALDPRWGAALAAAAGALAFAYGVNALCDREGDLDPRKNPLAGAPSVPAGVHGLLLALAVWTLAWAYGAGGRSLWACACSLGVGWVYSAGPRLKRWAVVGSLTNLGIFLPLLWLGPDPGVSARASLASVFAGALLQNQLLHEHADAEEDRRAGVQTTAQWLGPRATAWLGVLLVWLGAALTGLGLAGDRWSAAQGPMRWLVAIVACAGTVPSVRPQLAPAQRRRLHRTLTATAGALLWLGTLVAGGRG